MDGQMTIFDVLNKEKSAYAIRKPVKLIELFAGIGAQSKALERLGVDFETHVISEWEVHACASYHKIHKKEDTYDYSKYISDKGLVDILFELGISIDGKTPMSKSKIKGKSEKWHRRVYNDFVATNNIGSITTIHGEDLRIEEKDKYCYLLTYSFPCQDLSIAGKGKGMSKGNGTRSGLLWEVERILHECKVLPDILLMENVPQIHSPKNISDFQMWQKSLEDLGYTNFYQDMNAKDYGIAQSRNRTFMISILDKNINFEFPEPIPLNKTMEDYLEDTVDSKYYIDNEKSRKLINQLMEQGLPLKKNGIDFSLKNAGLTPVANAIISRYDAGVTNRAHEGSCIIEESGE